MIGIKIERGALNTALPKQCGNTQENMGNTLMVIMMMNGELLCIEKALF